MHAEKKITFHSHKHSFTPYPSFSPYSPTDGMTEREMNTVTVRGLEELFFQLCRCVSFLVMTGNSFRCYWPTIPVVPLCLFLAAVQNSFWLHRSVFWLWREIVLGVTYLPTLYQLCSCVSFWLRQETLWFKKKFLLGFFILQKQWDQNFLLLCISFLLCMDLQLYSKNCFSKISRTLFDFLNNTYWVFLF